MSILSDVRNSYTLFRDNNSGIWLRGLRLVAEDRSKIGLIERQQITAQETRFEGWVDAEKVTVYDRDGMVLASTVPHISRPDVQRSLDASHDKFGFTLKVYESPERLRMTVTRHGHENRISLPTPSFSARAKNEIRLNRRYVWALASATPDILRWIFRRDEEARLRVGRLFRSGGKTAPTLNIAALSAEEWPDTPAKPITIVVPVYQGVHLLDMVIGRIRDNTDLPWHLVVVDDASPDAEVQLCLRRWQKRLTEAQMTLITAQVNRGFVGAANLGLEAAVKRGNDTVILNSDALVPAGWSSRLLQPMRNLERIASVTPFSNDAEIANVPLMGKPVTLDPGEMTIIDRVAGTMNGPAGTADAPTGVGFCMAMNIEMLRRNPLFDSVFGKGYGEEVDWCQKAEKLGWRNLLTAGVFVEHFGGQTFGSEAKLQLIQKNGKIITQRYPRFDQHVHEFISDDPLRAQRLRLGITLAAERARTRGRKLGVFLAHGLGGGAEVYLGQRLKAELNTVGFAVVIRTMPDQSWQLELHTQQGPVQGSVDEVGDMLPVFRDIDGLHFVYSCGVGAPKPLDIPETLIRLLDRAESSLEVTFNDFFPITPSYTLLNSHGAVSSFPLDRTDPIHSFAGPDGKTITIDAWTEAWGKLIARADQLTTFSRSSADIVARAWPAHQDRIVTRPHQLAEPVPAMIADRETKEPVIGVLGNISYAKGSVVLSELSEELARSKRGKIVLIGNLEPGRHLAQPSLSTGSYRLIQLRQLVEKHGISRWFFPSIWPETFSYVIHEVIATGLPVWSFDVGAQGDALREALQSGTSGGLLPLDEGRYDIKSIADALTS